MAGLTYSQTLDAFGNFLTAYIHTLLYLRSLYPRTSFVRSRFHNTPVYQSRHPLVCEWIYDAVAAVRTELIEGTVARIGIVIFSYGHGSKNGGGGSDASKSTGDVQIMERFMLDVSAFPFVGRDNLNAVLEWGSRPSSQASSSAASSELDDHVEDDDHLQHNDEMEEGLEKEEVEAEDHDLEQEAGTPNRERTFESPDAPRCDLGVDTNLAEQMRAALISLTSRCAALKPLPAKCSFNIAMELRDEADVDPPIGHPQAWIPVQPSLQKTGRGPHKQARVEEPKEESTQDSKKSDGWKKQGEDLGGLKFTPIRAVETGTFRFETWVEEGKAKFASASAQAREKQSVRFAESGVVAQKPKVSFEGSKAGPEKPKGGVEKPGVSFEEPKISFSTSSGGSPTKS